MGQELSSTTGITRMTGGWHLAHNKPIAGEFYAFGIDGQGISAKQLETVKARMETVKTKLENQQFEGLTKDDLIGNMLHAGALSYFAANDAYLKMLNKGEQALAYRQPSFGTFSTSLDTVYSFGVPRQSETGAGAYRISGGDNGGEYKEGSLAGLNLIFTGSLFIVIGMHAFLPLLVGIFMFITGFILYDGLEPDAPFNINCGLEILDEVLALLLMTGPFWKGEKALRVVAQAFDIWC